MICRCISIFNRGKETLSKSIFPCRAEGARGALHPGAKLLGAPENYKTIRFLFLHLCELQSLLPLCTMILKIYSYQNLYILRTNSALFVFVPESFVNALGGTVFLFYLFKLQMNSVYIRCKHWSLLSTTDKWRGRNNWLEVYILSDLITRWRRVSCHDYRECCWHRRSDTY